MPTPTPPWTAILDDRLYRILPLDTELVNQPGNFSVKITNDSSTISASNPLGDVLILTDLNPQPVAPVRISVGRLIASTSEAITVNNPIDPTHLQNTTFFSTNSRLIKLHVNISTTRGYRVLMINDNLDADNVGAVVDPTGQQLVIVTPTNTYNLDATTGPKIPPQTDSLRFNAKKQTINTGKITIEITAAD